MAECILYSIHRFVDYYTEDGYERITLDLIEMHLHNNQAELDRAINEVFRE